MKITIFPGKYHQNGGFSMAMLVYRRVPQSKNPGFFARSMSSGPPGNECCELAQENWPAFKLP